MEKIVHYCQKCKKPNPAGEFVCSNCGTRLMIVTVPPATRFDDEIIPSYYEDHLLERISILEIQFGQLADKVSEVLDLMIKNQSINRRHQNLIETVIDELSSVVGVEKKTFRKNIKKKKEIIDKKEVAEKTKQKIEEKILAQYTSEEQVFPNLIKQGIDFIFSNDEKQGIKVLEKALYFSPKNFYLLNFIGRTYFLLEKFDVALDTLNSANQVKPDFAENLLMLGFINANFGQFTESKDYISKIRENEKYLFCANFIYGMVSAVESNWSDALVSFKNLQSEFPSAETNYLLGCVYFQMERFKMAIKYFVNATNLDKNFSDSWFMLSICYQRLRQEQKAREMLENSLNCQENNSQSLAILKKNHKVFLLQNDSLPFLQLKQNKKNVLLNLTPRLSKMLRDEIKKALV